MAKKKPGYSTITINAPTGVANVNTDMGLNSVACNGSCTVPSGWVLDFVYGIVYQSGTPGMENAQSGDVDNPLTGTFSFSTDLYGAACNGGGTAANQVKVWCILKETSTALESPSDKSQNFTGQCVNLIRKQSKKIAFAWPGIPLDFVPKFGRWRFYEHAAVNHPHEGCILMDHGRPLLASEIEVAADNVLWRTKNENDTGFIQIDTPRGINQLSPSNDVWRFRRKNKYGIIIWQINGIRELVTSESKSSPTVIRGLNPHSPIFVQVNDRMRKFSDNSGTFDLYVREI